MKYMLLMSGTKPEFNAYAQWPREAHATHAAFMRKLSKELAGEGSFVSTLGLGWPTEAKLVRAAPDGSPVTDGVFPESKEFLAGLWIVDVESAAEAYHIAARLSSQPSPQGGSAPIEVRQILGGPPEEYL